MDEEKEDLLWDRLLPKQCPILRERYYDIRGARNGVMHAHNINKAKFDEIQQLFKSVNDEIDRAIESLADGALIPENYNRVIGEALALWLTDDGDLVVDDGSRRIVFALSEAMATKLEDVKVGHAPSVWALE